MAGNDKSPWKGFQEQAAAGKIDIAEDAAQRAAGIVADALTMMLIAKSATDRIDQYEGFGNLPSGQTLAQRFFRAARDLDDRLAEDEKILRGMGEMFLYAGKLYEDNDQSAADQFESLRMDTFGNWKGTHRDFPGLPLAGEGRLPGWASDLSSGTTGDHFPEGNKLPAPNSEVKPQSAENGSGGSIPIELVRKPSDPAKEGDRWTGDPNLENAYALEYGTFYSLGQSLGDHAQEVVDAAAVWNWISDRLDVAFGDLANGIEQLHTSGDWGGKGPEASVTAAMTYRANVLELTGAVSSIGNNLSWTSGWLHTVRINMPSMASWDGEGGTATVGRPYARDVLLPRARTAFNSFYVPGIQQSGAAIPAIPAPNKELLTVTPEKPGPGPGAGPGKPTGGPAPTSTPNLPQMMSAQQPRLEQFERAQQAGPSLREQQEAARKQQEAAERFQREQQQAAREQQVAAAQFQREQQEAARRQQAQQAAQQAAQQVQQAAQQAVSAGQQAAQEALAAAQQAAAGIPGMGGLPALSAAEAARAAALNTGKGAGGGSGAGLGGGLGAGSKPTTEVSKLFPRAGAVTSTTGAASGVAAGRAGMAPAAGYPGSPGAAGAAGRSAGQGEGDHKRPTFLDSAEHLDEAIGEAPIAFRPVVEQ